MSYQIHQPAIPNADDKWTAAEHNGNLLLFFPTEIRRGIKTSNGEADAVSCSRVVNLDTGRILHNTLIFGTALVPNIGPGAPDGVVVGRLGQGVGKNGNNPPWILNPHDEADLRRAQEWLALDAQGAVTQPAQQQSAGGQFAGQWGNATPPAATFNPQQAQATGNGWGQQAAPAPAQGGWGAPAPAAAPAQGGWGTPAPAPEPDPTTYDEYVAAFKRKGVDPAQVTSPEQAAQLWALVKNNPNVA